MGGHIRRVLPRGGTLPIEEWEQRHRALLVFLWANALGLPLFGILDGYGVGHSLLHASGLFGFAILAMARPLGRMGRSLCVSLGLLTAAALLVHVTHGLIEAHFYFFVMIGALTLYEDWKPFLLAVAYVLLHHGAIGMLAPTDVFNHPGGLREPWEWAAIHALFVAGAGAAAVTAWRLNENVRESMLAAQALLQDAAMIDILTDLPNRRQLMADLEALESGDGEPVVLAMFDLDGFKAYNDTFGHAAGDALLTRLGGRLADSAPDPARAYRLGGDEFCVLAPVVGIDPEPFLESAAAALSEHGEGFAIGCSHGSVTLPTETADTEEALQLADRRMYVRKTGGRPSAGRQVGDALLRALEARHPDLGDHLGGVAGWSEAVARRLGLDEALVLQIRQAAELHDVGKVAIPDAILLKPGELDPDERAFIERHTIIGERIVGAAPALTRVAELVRSSHEWFDGTGYPDRLAGRAIPLGSRIIAVCDAYDAMVSPRPYRPDAKSPVEALAELTACAGTQFDPGIVSAFVAVMAHSRATDASSPAVA
ncbi:MAG TPA: diguanylate cyclase [Solirubrobacteraceae bacterium]|nr:diguanylate cyclase [Solirubrobacteraceae bacterium]